MYDVLTWEFYMCYCIFSLQHYYVGRYTRLILERIQLKLKKLECLSQGHIDGKTLGPPDFRLAQWTHFLNWKPICVVTVTPFQLASQDFLHIYFYFIQQIFMFVSAYLFTICQQSVLCCNAAERDWHHPCYKGSYSESSRWVSFWINNYNPKG